MFARDSVAADMTAREIVIERVFDAPRERVWDIFTRPEHLRKWWGPKVVRVPVAEFVARPGGRIFLGERGPDGVMRYIAGVVREIERPARIAFAIHFADDRGQRVPPPSGAGLPSAWQGDILATVTFAEVGQRTRVTVHQSLWSVTAEWGEMARAGWGEALDKLALVVAGGAAGRDTRPTQVTEGE